jgi:hypothetical protein
MMHLRQLATTENSLAQANNVVEQTWGDLHDENTIVSKDWTYLSINSDEINKAASPFDDIGYLATDNAPSKSFNMKGSNAPVDPPTPEVSNKGNNREETKAAATTESSGTGPSLNDFFKREKRPPLTTQQRRLNQDIVSKASSRLPFRRLQKTGSKRGDICNIPSGDNPTDDESIGISTIVSMNTTKCTSRIFEISKGSLTLSMLGNSKLSKSQYNDSKSRGTRTTEATSSHTKSTMVSAFGSSMFSRDSSKNKERLREMVEQLEGVNQTLTSENKELHTRLEQVSQALYETSFYEAWFSVQELAEAQKEVCQLRAFQCHATREQESLEAKVENLTNIVEIQEAELLDLKTANQTQADRIAYLEMKLLENQLDPSHHHQVVSCENPAHASMADSFGSFDSFGTMEEEDDDQHSYEEELNGESEKSESAHGNFKAFALIPQENTLDLPNPPPPPPSNRCLTDPCTSFRKKPAVRSNSFSPGKGNKRTSRELLANTKKNPTTFTTNDSTAVGPVISSSRVTERPRRSRSNSMGSRSKAREPRSVDGTRMRRATSFSSSDKDKNGAATSGLTKQASRRRLKSSNISGDGLDNSQHSSKSNKSGKSNKSAKSSGTARRRAVGKPLTDPLSGPGSSHSTRSAARRRLRNTAIVEADRGAVRDALNRQVGVEEDDFPVTSSQDNTLAATSKLIRTHRRSMSSDFTDMVSSKPMALVQDRAKLPKEPLIQPRLTNTWATSA